MTDKEFWQQVYLVALAEGLKEPNKLAYGKDKVSAIVWASNTADDSLIHFHLVFPKAKK